jgi:hypothetical protein
VTDSSNFVEASVSLADHGTCNGDDGYLTGDHIVKLDKGIATFSALEVFCFPEHSLNVSFGSDSQQAMTSTVYDFRPCVRGEYYADRACNSCPHGFYSFTEPETELLTTLDVSICVECPIEASECHGSTITLRENYWRSNGTRPPYLYIASSGYYKNQCLCW